MEEDQMTATNRTIGILGGMGPLATVDLYRKIIESTPAGRDQDHLHVIIDADPTVPDRTEALLRGGEDPTPWLVRGAKRLADAGAAFIVIPCNTAHAFLSHVEPTVAIPILNMIEEAARSAATQVQPGASVGVLATEGTLAAGLYQAALERAGLQAVAPGPEAQQWVNQAIDRVKAGKADSKATCLVGAAADELIQSGVQALFAACTELPIILPQERVTVPLIDPTMSLAQAAVREATTGRTTTDGIPKEVEADAVNA